MKPRDRRKTKPYCDLNVCGVAALPDTGRPFQTGTMPGRGSVGELTCGSEWVISDGNGASAPGDGKVDLERIRRAVREILLAVGEDPDREGLVETPDRVARMYAEVFRGLHQDPAAHLRKKFTQRYDEVVVVKDIEFSSFCEHHLLPFTGKAHVGYLPRGQVVGLSKIPRVIDTLSRRPQLQERLTQEAAELLMRELDAKGVAVVI